MKRWCAGIAVAVSLLLHGAPSEAGAGKPLRSGTIVFGVPVTGPTNCSASPDCLVWLRSGCDPRLAGRDPAISSSIVDVRKFAGSTRRLSITTVTGNWLTATNYEFWSRGCRWVGRTLVSSGAASIKIPRGASWMTVPSSIGPYHWEMR